MGSKKLCPAQSKILNQLYNMCLNDESEIFALSGSTGSGKTEIINHLTTLLQESWSTIYVCGINASISPYQTFYLSNLIFKNKLSLKSISYGINFIPSHTIMLGIEKQNGLFSDIENVIIRTLNKQISGINLLIIADNYHDWDLASQELLIKIYSSHILRYEKVKILCVQESGPDGLLMKYIKTQNNLHLDNLTEIDIKHLCNNFLVNPREMDYSLIKNLIYNNLYLLEMYCEYQDCTIIQLIDEKLKNVTDKKKLNTFLEALSIIESTFKTDDMSYYDLNIDEFMTMELLDESMDISMLSGVTTFAFTNKIYREYFLNKLKNKRKPLHKKFAQFLQNNYPDDYFSRAKHLVLSEIFPKDAFYLLSIETVRRSFCISKKNLKNYIQTIIQPIFNEIKKMMNPTEYSSAQQLVNQYYQSIIFFKDQNLSDAEQVLEAIMLEFLPSHMKAEIARQKLICTLHKASDYRKIKKYTTELYNIIEHKDFNEDEQWCRSALILFSVYSYRLYDADRLEYLVVKFETYIMKHREIPLFTLMQYAFKRRSAIFYESVPAMLACKESCDFFEGISDIKEYYMALNNFAANCLVSNKINDARNAIEKAITIMHTDEYTPSRYKIFCNKMVASFLSEEAVSEEIGNDKIEKILIEFSCLLQGEEKSHIIDFNKLSLNFLLSNLDECEKIIKYLSESIKNDKYYCYYLNNAIFFFSYLQKDFIMAEKYLRKMKEIDAPLLNLYNNVFEYRHELCEKILLENDLKNPHELDKYFQKNRNNEPAWTFYGRAFLFSDIQYLSM